MGKGKNIGAGRFGWGVGVVIMGVVNNSTSISTQIPNQKAAKQIKKRNQP